MYNENNTLSLVKIEPISIASGAHSAPFWDGLRGVAGTLDAVREIRPVFETFCSMGNETESYNLILAVYDLIAATPLDIIDLEPYRDAIKQFITEFLLYIDDLLSTMKAKNKI